MGMTMTQKILAAHAGLSQVEAGQLIEANLDLVLANGQVIQCVIGDQKADKDTNSQNAIGNDGSAAEFIVETSKLNHTTHYRGNVSFASKGWNSKVVKVRLYNKNAFSS